MIAAKSTGRFDAANCPSTDRGLWQAGQAALAIKQRWQEGEPPDAARALESQPHLRQYPAVVVELACEEYALRQRAGEKLEPEPFSHRFPTFQRALYLKLAAHSILVQDPGFQAMRDDLPWPAPGQRFMQFDLIAEIGRGAFGRVFLANEPVLGNRPIVVKVAPGGGDEAEILANFSTPTLCRSTRFRRTRRPVWRRSACPTWVRNAQQRAGPRLFGGVSPDQGPHDLRGRRGRQRGVRSVRLRKSRPAGGSYGRLVC